MMAWLEYSQAPSIETRLRLLVQLFRNPVFGEHNANMVFYHHTRMKLSEFCDSYEEPQR